MMESIYNGMSGLLAFSKGLNTISSNVSNMNTPGFKSSELQFLDVFYKSEYSSLPNGDILFSQFGGGVDTGSTTTRFSSGEIRATGNDLDVAIDGNGFIVLKMEDELFYSRAGQFQFDDKGFLVSKLNQAKVMAIDETGNLYAVNQNNFLSIPQAATSLITFTGILSTGTLNADGDQIYTVSDQKLIDALGKERFIDFEFKLTDILNLEWSVNVLEDGTLIASDLVQFDPSGSPRENENKFEFSITAEDGTLSTITLSMGDAGNSNASTSSSFGTTSTLKSLDIDGFSAGSLVSTRINEYGVLVSEYSNGESQDNAQLALASFLQLQNLEQKSGGLFSADGVSLVFSNANNAAMGRFVPGAVELSNVELTQQFGDLIIVQRGYQASSQILTVSNEMLQQLIEMRGRG